MKSNYEHFVLTASCLKADLWSAALRHAQGRPALIFRPVAHPNATMPAVPNRIQPTTVPTAGFWSYFCSWATGAWDKISTWGPNCAFLKTRICPSARPAGPGSSSAGPAQAVPAQTPLMHPPGAGTATLSPCPRRELQAQTAPTQPSARIQSTTGGIRGFRRLIAEFTFIQSVCVRGERRGLT